MFGADIDTCSVNPVNYLHTYTIQNIQIFFYNKCLTNWLLVAKPIFNQFLALKKDRAERHCFLTKTLVILFPFFFPPNKREKKERRMNNQIRGKKTMPFCSIYEKYSPIIYCKNINYYFHFS